MGYRSELSSKIDPMGAIIAISLIGIWFFSLIYWLNFNIDFFNPLLYLGILLLTHLYTGLFITAHDAMHGVVSKHSKINHFIGWLAALLFSFNFYWRLFPKHHQHHQFVATGKDPDYHEPTQFLPWYISFLFTYVNIWQILLMAIAFNLLKLVFPVPNLVIFWIFPAILSTLQLFYFGTYQPHKGTHSNKHKSGTLSANHIWAFVSCYFFGYHYEHHELPNTPWWRLWKTKKYINFKN